MWWNVSIISFSHTSFCFLLFSFFGKCVVPNLHRMELDDCIIYQKYRTVFFRQVFYRCFRRGCGAVQKWCPSYCTLSFDTLIPRISTWCFPPAPHHWRVMEDMRKIWPDTWIDLGKGLVLSHYLYGSGQCLVGLLQGLVFSHINPALGAKPHVFTACGKWLVHLVP